MPQAIKMRSTASALVFLQLSNQLAAWYIPPAAAPHMIPIQGQRHLNIVDADVLRESCADVVNRLQSAGESFSFVHWLLDSAACTKWLSGLPGLLPLQMSDVPVQGLSWAWVAARFGVAGATLDEVEPALKALVLPWLVSADDAAERQQLQAALLNEHTSESERLAAERAQLELQNERLRAENAALQQVDREKLVSFLPALFHNVFRILGNEDLALLCGWVAPLPIPNPYPEPSEETVRTLQRRFRTLPQHLQRQIVHTVAHLPQRQKLQPRPEMRELIAELEGR